MTLSLSQAAVEVVTADVRRFGQEQLETGGFLLSDAVAPGQITRVALAGTAGVTRQRDRFVVSGLALERLFTWSAEHDLRVRAQFHSHGGRAFLSPVDLRHGFSVSGFISCIVPFSADPPSDPTEWGWWRFEDSKWIAATPPVLHAELSLAVATFDADGVR